MQESSLFVRQSEHNMKTAIGGSCQVVASGPSFCLSADVGVATLLFVAGNQTRVVSAVTLALPPVCKSRQRRGGLILRDHAGSTGTPSSRQTNKHIR
jgi:hypothetical protein